MKKLKAILISIFQFYILSVSGIPDDGAIKGIIRDAITKQTLPGATISYNLHGHLQGTFADENGQYLIRPLPPGHYELTFSFTGYQKVIRQEITVSSGTITFLDIELNNDNNLPPVVIDEYRDPLITRDYMGGITKIAGEDIEHNTERDIKNLVAQTAGTYQKEENGALNIRGSRVDATQYYVDGIKIIGGFSIPKSAIREITVISGSVPAQFGDATGGIVLITTKSAFNN